MLPVEIPAEVVSFLALYDLGPVLFANRRLSSIASKCVNGIPVWHFEHDVHLFVNENSMFMTAAGDVFVSVTGRENKEDPLDISLYNACFEYLSLTISADGVRSLPVKMALEIDELALLVGGVATAGLFMDVIDRFRKVQNILTICDRLMNLEKETEFDLEVFEPELPELQAKCSSLTTELELEKDNTAQLCGAKENALKESNDVGESLLAQNEALKKQIESLTARLRSLQ